MLGYTASGKRNIRSGNEYNHLFPATSVATNPYLSNRATTYDTLDYIQQIVSDTLEDTTKLAKVLKAGSLKKTCQNIWEFCFNNIQYALDESHAEQLRRPSRSWADRKKGIDCDCFAIMVSSILTNLHIPHACRIVKMHGRNYFQHIYVVVPIDPKSGTENRENYIVIDPVVDAFNDEPRGITYKYDRNMTIPVQYLNGVEERPEFGHEFDGLGAVLVGLGSVDHNEIKAAFLGCLKHHLVNTRDIIAENPIAVYPIYQPRAMMAGIDAVLANWDDDQARTATLEALAQDEHSFMNGSVGQFSGIDGLSNTEFRNLFGDDIPVQIVGLGDLGKLQVGKKIQAAVNKGKQVVQHNIQDKSKTFFKAVSNVNKNIDKKVQQVKAAAKATAQKVGDKAKVIAQKAAQDLKKVGQGIVRYNPITIAARGGVLLALKEDLFGIAKRLRWGYATLAQAKAKGLTEAEWKMAVNAVAKTEKLFEKIGGKKENLKDAVLKGKSGGLGLGDPASATMVTAAAGILKAIFDFVKGLKKNPGQPGNDSSDESDLNKLVQSSPDAAQVPEVAPQQTVIPGGSSNSDSQAPENGNNDQGADKGNSNEASKGSSMPLIIGAAAVAGLFLMSGGSSHSKPVNGPESKPGKTLHVKVK